MKKKQSQILQQPVAEMETLTILPQLVAEIPYSLDFLGLTPAIAIC